MVAARQGVEEAHASPAVQATQAPRASQTLSSPQELPAGRRSPVAEQVGVPLAHEIAPSTHGSSGTHESPSTHAPQAPSEHTPFEPQGVPSGELPAGTHAVTCPSQVIVPIRQAMLG